MNNAYKAMREFWLDVKNLQHKEEVPALGNCKICVAGIEMAALDRNGKIKNLILAASSLGNASMYFENNSPSGLGGFTGGADQGPVRNKAQLVLQAAAQAAEKMSVVPELAVQIQPQDVTLFTVSEDGVIRAASVVELDVRQTSHPLYGFFAYTQQLLGAFRIEQEIAAKITPITSRAKTDKETE